MAPAASSSSLPPLRIGTRGSALALWQANYVRAELERRGWPARLEIIATSGDRYSARLSSMGGKGLFTREIEQALLAARVDLAVHSLKDVPAELPPGLALGAIPERADPRDVLLAAGGKTLAQLPPGARVGTSSLRRRAQLLALRPELEIVPLSGNIDTRLRKWRAGEAAAIVLAAAGLLRLDSQQGISEWFDPGVFLPAAGQGALAIECRADDAALLERLRALHHAPSAAAAGAERRVLQALGAGCQSALAVHADSMAEGLRLRARLFSPDGRECLKAEARGPAPLALGAEVARQLQLQGAARLLQLGARPAPSLP